MKSLKACLSGFAAVLLACLTFLPGKAVNDQDILKTVMDEIEAVTSHSQRYKSVWENIALIQNGAKPEEGFLDSLLSESGEFYKEGLENINVTDMQRVCLGIIACGVDPQNVGGQNLLADCTFDRAKASPLDKQGITGLVWALILLDAKDFAVLENSKDTRQTIISKILALEHDSGGFSLIGSRPDADITAIVITALSLYTDDGNVNTCIDRSLKVLSQLQAENGAIKGMGKENCESTSQAVIALCSLGIDPFTDTRFIKKSGGLLDALLSFKTQDGGFSHLKGGLTNGLATNQALSALVAYKRLKNGEGAFYSFKTGVPEAEFSSDQEIPSAAPATYAGNTEAETHETVKAIIFITVPVIILSTIFFKRKRRAE